MSNGTAAARASESSWRAMQVYVMAAVCLGIGLAVGYLFRGSQSPAAAVHPPTTLASNSLSNAPAPGMPTLDQMKHMADKKAEPLLAKLSSDPDNAALLAQLGDIYKQTHQFTEATEYYRKALKVDAKNAGVRSDLASLLYYTGDVNGALSELQQALHDDPKNGAALFNLGMIKYQAKKDSAGAIAAWRELLQTNPKLPPERKTAVEKLIKEAGGR